MEGRPLSESSSVICVSASTDSSVKSAVLKILDSSSPDRAMVSSPVSSAKKPLEVSCWTSSWAGSSSVAVFLPHLKASKSFLRLEISFLSSAISPAILRISSSVGDTAGCSISFWLNSIASSGFSVIHFCDSSCICWLLEDSREETTCSGCTSSVFSPISSTSAIILSTSKSSES